MGKLQRVGSGFVKYGNQLINLKAYKEITNEGVSYNDYQGYGIKFTPLQPLKEDYENNVDGSSHITYTPDEANDLEEDFILIQQVLSE